ncbi:hypothetical protein PoB_005056900 [Plakobranchus ocellatus]|uniref:Uncharacterized protein n=1 Tax=Plakobranchus ocellatus TaxID=259542 RepID=A0AAV4BV38_9GAST|nr:hypothetical protein PoB_005056900 [Plakobranchus ocellatus]
MISMFCNICHKFCCLEVTSSLEHIEWRQEERQTEEKSMEITVNSNICRLLYYPEPYISNATRLTIVEPENSPCHASKIWDVKI